MFVYLLFNLFVTSNNETTNSPVHQFMNLKCCTKAREPFKIPFNGVLFLIYYFKQHFKPCFFTLKTFCSTINSGIGEFVVSLFDVTNRLLMFLDPPNPKLGKEYIFGLNEIWNSTSGITWIFVFLLNVQLREFALQGEIYGN